MILSFETTLPQHSNSLMLIKLFRRLQFTLAVSDVD